MGGTSIAKDIDPVDLHPQCRRNSPHEGPHAAVADGQAFLAPGNGLVVVEIGPRNPASILSLGMAVDTTEGNRPRHEQDCAEQTQDHISHPFLVEDRFIR